MSDVAKNLEVAAERRMEEWLLTPELKEHMQKAKDVKKPAKTGPYIAISREAASGGTEIAREVGRRLGWDVLDKEVLGFMTDRYGMPRDMLDIVDENKANWFHDVLGSFIDSRIVSRDSYVIHLERIIYLAALHGKVVLIGRGAQCVLPRNCGLVVRFVAPKKQRVEELMRRLTITESQAVSKLDRTDASRNEFCRRHFHRDITDPLESDLVLNTSRMTAEVAAELIIDVSRRKGLVNP